jgi:DNA polymerase-3 subunit delta
VPALDVSALRKHIKSGKLSPLYLLVGEDVKLVDAMVDGIESTVDPADRPFAVERLYAGEAGASPIDIAAAARVYPMLGDRRIVFVLRAERILKPKRASKAAAEESDESAAEESSMDFAPLEEYLDAPAPSTTLVFVAADIDKGRRFSKNLIAKAQTVVFGGFDTDTDAARRAVAGDAKAVVNAELVREGRAMDAAALDLLVNRSGGDITKLRGDLERVLLYTQGQAKISAADVQETVTAETMDDPFAVTTAIGAGNVGLALKEAAARLERGDSPHALVGMLRWWVSARLSESAPHRVHGAIDALLRTDLALKSSGGDERMLIERLVVELAGAPGPRRG